MRAVALLGGTLVDPVDGMARADLLIEGGTITAIGAITIPDDAERIDAAELHIAPGIIDLGVFAVDARACAAGGITRVAPMGDGAAVLDHPGLVQRSALAAKPDLWVHPLAAATRRSVGQAETAHPAELGEYALMRQAGARGIATGREWIADSGLMARVLAWAKAADMPVIAHAEDGGLTCGAVATSGLSATLLGLAAAPAIAEAMAIVRDLMLVEQTGARLHFRQVTTHAGLDLVRAAIARGLPVSCGITPAHLLLSDHAIGDYRTYARLSPPLRADEDRRACLEALADGTISILGSGHDPRAPEEKRLPFAEAQPGMAGAETLLPLGLGLVRDGTIDLPRLFDLLATRPARLLGLDTGRLTVGMPADLCVFDSQAPWVIRGEAFRARAANTPFEGLPVQGRVIHCFKGGRRTGP